LSAIELRRLIVELQQRYFSEYADAWSQALGQVRLRETDNLRQDAEQLARLTSAQSPLVLLLQQVRENTRLLSTDAPMSAVPHEAGDVAAIAQSMAAR
ncbi:ImcF-related family protein, partial [Pseudomonas viridiflava]